VFDLRKMSLLGRLGHIGAWAALLWILVLTLLQLSTSLRALWPALAAPELNPVSLLALGLPPLAQVLRPHAQRLAALAIQAGLGLVGLMLLEWGMRLDSAVLLSNSVVDGVSMAGRYALAGWLLLSGLAAWALLRPGHTRLSVALSLLALLSMGDSALAVFTVTCWLVFGNVPGASLLFSLPVLLALLWFGLALVMIALGEIDRQGRSAPDQGYRWVFARNLGLLLTTSVLAGLAAAAVVSAQSADLLTEGLRARAERQARVLERHVGRAAALVAGAYQQALAQPGATTNIGWDRDGFLRTLQSQGEHIELAADAREAARRHWVSAVPVLRTAELTAGVLTDGRIRIELPAKGRQSGLQVQLQLWSETGESRTESDRQLRQPLLICQAGEQDLLLCSEFDPGGDSAPAAAERFSVAASGWRERGHRLVELSSEGQRLGLGALAPIGDEGSYLMLRVSAASLFRSVGGPMLLAMLLLSGLALLGAAWSYWRQLPRLRKLYLSHAQSQATLHHLPLATLVLDAQQRMIRVNPAAEHLLGAPASHWLGLPVAGLLPDWPHCIDLRPLADGTSQSHNLELMTADSTRVPVEVLLASYTLLGRRGILVMLRDLRAELNAARTMRRWTRVFEDSGWGVVIGSVGTSPVLELVNPAYARMLGYRPEELVGQLVRQHVPVSHWETLTQLRRGAELGGSVQGEMRHKRRDGSEIPTLVSISAVRDDSGALLHFVVSVQDISALKNAEQTATRHALHLRAVLDALPVGVWIGDLHGQTTQTNPAARQLWLGDSALQMSDWRGSGALPIQHDSLMRRAVVLRGTLDSGLVDFDRAPGERRSLLTTASPMFDPQGEVIGAIAIDEDLSSLRRSELAARAAHDLLERILDAGVVGVALCDAVGRVLRHNLAWNLLIGPDAEADVLRSCLEPDDALLQKNLIARVARGELPTYVSEHRMHRVGGSLGWTLLIVCRLPATLGEEDRVLVQVLDVDERRRNAEELASNHLRLAAAQKLAGIGDWQWDKDSGLFSCSDQMLRMLDKSLAASRELSREQLLAHVHPDDRTSLAKALDKAWRHGEGLALDMRLLRSGGPELIVHMHGTVQRAQGAMSMSGTMQDISERKRIESELRDSRERLRELVAYESEVIEQERKRIAREVHDELGQLLTALRMDLSMLRGQLEPGGASAQRAAQMRETMVTMTEVVRHIASNLRPAALDLGLVAAIEWLAEDFSLRWETRCELQLPRAEEGDLTSLSEAASLALFRAVQESLTNIAKYAHATEVVIALSCESGQLRLCVSDNGCGFDLAEVAARRGGGLGLLGMRERMHALGARLHIESGTGGTLIDISYNIGRSPDS